MIPLVLVVLHALTSHAYISVSVDGKLLLERTRPGAREAAPVPPQPAAASAALPAHTAEQEGARPGGAAQAVQAAQVVVPPARASFLAAGSGPALQGTVRAPSIDLYAVAAEFIAMTLFVLIGCGSAMGIAKEEGSAWVFQVSLTFGTAITSLAYAVGHYSGGQINCAVTLGLVLTGHCTVVQGAANLAAQLLGSVTGALVLAAMYPEKKDRTGGLATNAVGEGWGHHHALIGEFFMTFLLVFVVLQTATNPASLGNRALAPVAIGLAVFLAHSVLIPIDGCSINPTRSFGPAVVAQCTRAGSRQALADMWVFWVGPLLGAAAAAGVATALLK